MSRLRAAGCVFAEDEARLLMECASTPDDLAAKVDQRVAGLPLEQVLGWAEFAGLRIAVAPGVFVPRHRTEFLVQQAVRYAPPRPVVVDLCCGTGALGVALCKCVEAAELHAADLAPAAVECARSNIEPLGGHVYQGDLFQPLPATLAGRVDVLLSNVPYVPTDAIAMLPPEARVHEPRLALDGGPDGLDIVRRVAQGASCWLAPGGRVYVETSRRQAQTATTVFTAARLRAFALMSDDLDSTVIVGQMPSGILPKGITGN